MKRRTLLFSIPALVGITGCSNQNDGAQSDTTTPEPCESEIYLPSPSDRENVESKSYPSLPDDVRESSLVAFANEFETAYQYNTLLIEQSDLLEVSVQFSQGSYTQRGESTRRYSFTVDTMYSYEDDDSGQTVSGTRRHTVGYEITADRALRAESESGDLSESDYAVVLCAEDSAGSPSPT